jgi:hypothetical protein
MRQISAIQRRQNDDANEHGRSLEV